MLTNKKLIKITVHIVFVIIFIFFSTLEAKNLEKFNKAENIADYFSGILLLNQSKYIDSHKYLKKLDGLEKSHSNYSKKYIYSLVNSGNLNQAFNFAKKLDREQKNNFETDLVLGIYYLKNSKYDLAKKYFNKANRTNSISVLNNYIVNTLYIWSDLENKNLEAAQLKLNQLDNRFENLKKIQNVFLHCYYSNKITDILFYKLISNEKTDFSRYYYFYARHVDNRGQKIKAREIVQTALKKYPRNLLLNQYKINLDFKKNFSDFNCSKKNDIVAELL